MSKTLDEICDILVSRYDTELLIEMLQITSEELLERFDDKVAERYDKLNEELEDE